MQLLAHTKRLPSWQEYKKILQLYLSNGLCSGHLCVRALYMWEVTMDGNPMLQLLNPKISTETAISVLFSFHFLYCSLFFLFSQGIFTVSIKIPPTHCIRGISFLVASWFFIHHAKCLLINANLQFHMIPSMIPTISNYNPKRLKKAIQLIDFFWDPTMCFVDFERYCHSVSFLDFSISNPRKSPFFV